MGEVYRVHDRTLGRDVALKVLSPSFASDPGRLARFEREAKLLAALNHPHIAHVDYFHDFDVSADGQRFLFIRRARRSA
jgi:serine/threonine protein kinase